MPALCKRKEKLFYRESSPISLCSRNHLPFSSRKDEKCYGQNEDLFRLFRPSFFFSCLAFDDDATNYTNTKIGNLSLYSQVELFSSSSTKTWPAKKGEKFFPPVRLGMTFLSRVHNEEEKTFVVSFQSFLELSLCSFF